MKNVLVFPGLILMALSANAQSAKYRVLKSELLKAGFSIQTEKYAEISEGQYCYEWTNFYRGASYVVIACSDDDNVVDMDARLYETDGTLYQEDESTDPFVYVKITPAYSRQMKVVVRNDDAVLPNYPSRVRYIIAYK